MELVLIAPPVLSKEPGPVKNAELPWVFTPLSSPAVPCILIPTPQHTAVGSDPLIAVAPGRPLAAPRLGGPRLQTDPRLPGAVAALPRLIPPRTPVLPGGPLSAPRKPCGTWPGGGMRPPPGCKLQGAAARSPGGRPGGASLGGGCTTRGPMPPISPPLPGSAALLSMPWAKPGGGGGTTLQIPGTADPANIPVQLWPVGAGGAGGSGTGGT